MILLWKKKCPKCLEMGTLPRELWSWVGAYLEPNNLLEGSGAKTRERAGRGDEKAGLYCIC